MRFSGRIDSSSRWRKSPRKSRDSFIPANPSSGSTAAHCGRSRVRSFERWVGGRAGVNISIASSGQINFTLAHEFGHYLLNRTTYPDGFNCSAEEMVRWDTRYGQVEHQANVFASYLLMPLDDFRRQVSPSAAPNLDELGGYAHRYDVSLTTAALKWLSCTQRHVVLVASREDGYILWSRSSKAALRHWGDFQDDRRTAAPGNRVVAGRARVQRRGVFNGD